MTSHREGTETAPEVGKTCTTRTSMKRRLYDVTLEADEQRRRVLLHHRFRFFVSFLLFCFDDISKRLVEGALQDRAGHERAQLVGARSRYGVLVLLGLRVAQRSCFN